MEQFHQFKKLISPSKPATTKQWIVASCVGIAVSTTVLITTLVIRAKRISKIQRKPLPTADELSKINGAYFIRPSDGKRMEYFSLNAGIGKNAVIIFHGSMGTGYCWSHWRTKQILPILQKHNLQLICPTMPGHGTSEPMRLENCKTILENISNDMLSLLNTLKVKEISVGGISYGVEPAFYLAQKALQSTEDIQVKAVSSICGAAWSTKTFYSVADQDRGWFVNMFSKLFAQPTLLEFMAVYVLDAMMSGAAFQLPKEQLERMKDVVDVMQEDMKRGFEYFYDGLGIAPTRNALQRGNDMNADYAFFSTVKGVMVNFHYGDQDTDVPVANRRFIMDKIPNGKLFAYVGTHMDVPLVEAVKQMVERTS